MNIWILTSEFPPDFGGGIGMYVENAARMFSENGHKVTVFCRDFKKDSVEYINENLRVIRFLHMKGEVYKFMGYWTALAYQYSQEVISIIEKEGKPDIIEVQDYNAIGYYLLQKKWLRYELLKDVPIVVHLHTPTFEIDKINQTPRYKFPSYWIGRMEKFCIRSADGLVCPSEFLRNRIQEELAVNNIEVIRLPYNFENNNIGRNFDSDTLLYIGRLEYRKGVLQMLKSVEKLWQQGYKFRLKLIGGDTYFHPRGDKLGNILKSKYKNRIDEGILIFKDSVPPEELTPEILEAKAVIVPSLYENFPYTCLTSMWLGAPMLVSKHGGQAEMVTEDESCGYVFNWEQNYDFEEKLIKILNVSPNNIIEMSKNAAQRIKKMCNMETNVQYRLEYYQKIINKSTNSDKHEFPIMTNKQSRLRKHVEKNVNSGVLSIIIPYYNLGEYINETLESALRSDYANKEVIIVNDGSNDNKSLQILTDIENKGHKNVKIVNIENAGLANARNVGAKAANGEFIAFLDADDLVDFKFYSRAIDILNSYNNISFVYSWVKYFDKRDGIWPTFNTEFPLLLGANMLSAFVVARKSDFINYGMNNPKMEYGLEDYDGWISMCLNGCFGVSIPEALAKYRVRSESMSRQFNRNMLHYLRDVMSHKNEEAYREYGVEIFNLIDANGPGYLWDNPTLLYPEVNHSDTQNNVDVNEYNSVKYELMRIANTRVGVMLIKIFLKLKINKLLK